jgi:hypothetical protein
MYRSHGFLPIWARCRCFGALHMSVAPSLRRVSYEPRVVFAMVYLFGKRFRRESPSPDIGLVVQDGKFWLIIWSPWWLPMQSAANASHHAALWYS